MLAEFLQDVSQVAVGFSRQRESLFRGCFKSPSLPGRVAGEGPAFRDVSPLTLPSPLEGRGVLKHAVRENDERRTQSDKRIYAGMAPTAAPALCGLAALWFPAFRIERTLGIRFAITCILAARVEHRQRPVRRVAALSAENYNSSVARARRRDRCCSPASPRPVGRRAGCADWVICEALVWLRLANRGAKPFRSRLDSCSLFSEAHGCGEELSPFW